MAVLQRFMGCINLCSIQLATNHTFSLSEFTQNVYREGVNLLAQSFGYKARAFSKNVQALVSLGYIICGEGQPLQIQWANTEKKVTNELVEEVIHERRRIDRKTIAAPSARKAL